MNPISLILVIFYVILCYYTANYHAKRRKVDVYVGTLACIFLTPLIGGLILVCFRERRPEDIDQEEEELNKPIILPVQASESIPKAPDKVTEPKTVKPEYQAKKYVKKVRNLSLPKIKFRLPRKILYILLFTSIGFCIVAMFMNPGYNSFKEFTPTHSTKQHYALRKRVSNYLVFSVYEIKTYDFDVDDEVFKESSSLKYIGFMENFYKKK